MNAALASGVVVLDGTALSTKAFIYLAAIFHRLQGVVFRRNDNRQHAAQPFVPLTYLLR